MATPPRLTAAELRQHLHWIIARRKKVDDPNRERLPDDPAQADPREVLDYLARYSGHVIPRWVRQADIGDRLALLVWLWWEDRRRELATLRTGLALGLFRKDLGAVLGITTGQGVRDRMDRLEALLAHDHPDEQITRAARRAAAADDPRRAWVQQHVGRISAVVTDVLAAAARHEVVGDWLAELHDDHVVEAWSPGSLAVLGLACAEVRSAAAVSELETVHSVHRALRRADLLRAEFAAVC